MQQNDIQGGQGYLFYGITHNCIKKYSLAAQNRKKICKFFEFLIFSSPLNVH